MQVSYLFEENGVEDAAYDKQWSLGLAFSDREKRLAQHMLQEHTFQPGTSTAAKAWTVACLLTPEAKNVMEGRAKDERNLVGSVQENWAGLHTTLNMYKVSYPGNLKKKTGN